MLNFTVNQATCIKCGKCVTECPARIISMESGQNPAISQENEANCYQCQHCLSICPAASISILGRDPKDSLPLTGNLPDASQMELLINGRRAVRNYKPENLEPEILHALLDVACYAPTCYMLKLSVSARSGTDWPNTSLMTCCLSSKSGWEFQRTMCLAMRWPSASPLCIIPEQHNTNQPASIS